METTKQSRGLEIFFRCLHGEDISVSSADELTEFRFTLPIVE